MDSTEQKLSDAKLVDAIDDTFQTLPKGYHVKIIIRAGHVGVWMEDNVGYLWPFPVSSSIGEAVRQAMDLAVKQDSEFGESGGE